MCRVLKMMIMLILLNVSLKERYMQTRSEKIFWHTKAFFIILFE
jgi:hypothetical protein